MDGAVVCCEQIDTVIVLISLTVVGVPFVFINSPWATVALLLLLRFAITAATHLAIAALFLLLAIVIPATVLLATAITLLLFSVILLGPFFLASFVTVFLAIVV